MTHIRIVNVWYSNPPKLYSIVSKGIDEFLEKFMTVKWMLQTIFEDWKKTLESNFRFVVPKTPKMGDRVEANIHELIRIKICIHFCSKRMKGFKYILKILKLCG